MDWLRPLITFIGPWSLWRRSSVVDKTALSSMLLHKTILDYCMHYTGFNFVHIAAAKCLVGRMTVLLSTFEVRVAHLVGCVCVCLSLRTITFKQMTFDLTFDLTKYTVFGILVRLHHVCAIFDGKGHRLKFKVIRENMLI